MTLDFICGTQMFAKSDENHIACLVAYEVAIYSAFVDDIKIEVYFLLFQLTTPFPNKRT
jgi:hypothetical protein